MDPISLIIDVGRAGRESVPADIRGTMPLRATWFSTHFQSRKQFSGVNSPSNILNKGIFIDMHNFFFFKSRVREENATTNRKIFGHPQLLPKAGLLHAFVIYPKLLTWMDQHFQALFP